MITETLYNRIKDTQAMIVTSDGSIDTETSIGALCETGDEFLPILGIEYKDGTVWYGFEDNLKKFVCSKVIEKINIDINNETKTPNISCNSVKDELPYNSKKILGMFLNGDRLLECSKILDKNVKNIRDLWINSLN